MIKQNGIVNIVKTNKYSVDLLKKELLYFNFKNLLRNQEYILIKPNICGGDWGKSHTQTSYYLLKNLIEIINEYNPYIKIGICEADMTFWDYDKILIDSVYLKLLDFENVVFINLSKGERELVDFGEFFGKTKVSKTLLKSYPLINVPKAKTHILCKMTAGIKNLFGLMPKKNKLMSYHLNLSFCKSLFEIANYFTPVLNIYDGIISCQGNCPISGEPLKTDFFMITDNILAGDIELAKIMGLNPEDVAYVKYGIEQTSPQYNVIGDHIYIDKWEKASRLGMRGPNIINKIKKILENKKNITTYSDFNEKFSELSELSSIFNNENGIKIYLMSIIVINFGIYDIL